MRKLPAWLVYTFWRLVLIAVPLLVLLLLTGYSYWIFDAIAAALIGLTLSYIFLRRQREEMSKTLRAPARARKTPTGDAAYEDELVDNAARAKADEDAAAEASDGQAIGSAPAGSEREGDAE